MAKKADAVQNVAQESDKDREQRGCIVEVGTPLWQRDGRMRHVQFKAGKMYVVDNMVHPDPRKGYICIEQDYDHVMHFCWVERSAGGAKEDDITPEPYDTIFKRVNKCTTGRVYMLKVRSINKNHFFWMQEPSAEKDTEISAKVNYLLNFPPPWLRFPQIACNLEVAELMGDGGEESGTNDIEQPRGSHTVLDFENCEALVGILKSPGNSQYYSLEISSGAEMSNKTLPDLSRMRQNNVLSGSGKRTVENSDLTNTNSLDLSGFEDDTGSLPQELNEEETLIKSSISHLFAARSCENETNFDDSDVEYVDTERALYHGKAFDYGTSAAFENSDTAKHDKMDVELVQTSSVSNGYKSVLDSPSCETSMNLLCGVASLENWESAVEMPYLACSGSGDNTCMSGTATESAEPSIQPSFGLVGDAKGNGSDSYNQQFSSSQSLEDWESAFDHGSNTNTRALNQKESVDNIEASNVESTTASAILQRSSIGSWVSALGPSHSAKLQRTQFQEPSGLAGSSSFDNQSIDVEIGTSQNIPAWKSDDWAQPGCSKAQYPMPSQIVNAKSRGVFSIFASTLTSYSDEEDENYIADPVTACVSEVKDESHMEVADSEKISRETGDTSVYDASVTNTIAMIVLAPPNETNVDAKLLREIVPSSTVASQQGSPGAVSESSSSPIHGTVPTSGQDPAPTPMTNCSPIDGTFVASVPVLACGQDQPESSSSIIGATSERAHKVTQSVVSTPIERTVTETRQTPQVKPLLGSSHNDGSVTATGQANPISGATPIDTIAAQDQGKSKSHVKKSLGVVSGLDNVTHHLQKRPDQIVPVQKKVRRSSPGVPLPSSFRVQDVSPARSSRYPQPNGSKLVYTPNPKSSHKRPIYQESDSDQELCSLKRTRISNDSNSSGEGQSCGTKALRSRAESSRRPLLTRTSSSKDSRSTNSGRYNLRKRSVPAKAEDGQQTEPVRIREIKKTGAETVVRSRANLQPPSSRARNDRANHDQGQNTRPVFVEDRRNSKSKPKVRKPADSNKKPKS